MNFVVLVGRVGADPTSGTTTSGKTWVNFSLATNRRKKDNSMETTWHRIVAYDLSAKEAIKVRKGDRVYIKGEIAQRDYEKDGVQQRSFEIIAQDVMRGERKPPADQPETEGEQPW